MLSSVFKFSLASVTKSGGTSNRKKAFASVSMESPASVNNVKSGVDDIPLAVGARAAVTFKSRVNAILHLVGYNRTTR